MKIQGHCPMGCGTTLFRDNDGHVTCSLIDCPNPSAVDKLLSESETEHVVEFPETGGWRAMHPLRERVETTLLDCELGRQLAALKGPPVKPGVYRVTKRKNDVMTGTIVDWYFQEIPT